MKLTERLNRRLKSLTTEGIVVAIVAFLCLVTVILFWSSLLKALIRQEYMFDAKDSTNDIIMFVFFSFLFVITLVIFIYNLFFRKFEKIKPVTKDIEHGTVVERKNGREEKLTDVLKQRESKNSAPGVSAIDKEKLKKNLKDKEDK